MLFLDKVDSILDQPISVAGKIAALRHAIIMEKIEHALRVAEIRQCGVVCDSYDVRRQLDIERRVSRLELIMGTAHLHRLRGI